MEWKKTTTRGASRLFQHMFVIIFCVMWSSINILKYNNIFLYTQGRPTLFFNTFFATLQGRNCVKILVVLPENYFLLLILFLSLNYFPTHHSRRSSSLGLSRPRKPHSYVNSFFLHIDLRFAFLFSFPAHWFDFVFHATLMSSKKFTKS